ncbi:IS3 family transposase [Moraxella nonliquefaciens]
MSCFGTWGCVVILWFGGVYDRIKTKLKGLSPVKYRNLVLGQTT